VKYPDIGTRLYGHAPIGERCIEVVRKVESPNSTVNLIVSLNGPEYYDVIAGATNNIEFLQFFTRGLNAVNPITLRPVLQTGDIVIMDNLSVHHFDAGEVLEEFLGEMGIELIYTPVYSPDLNPIEMCFNKLKTLLNYELKDVSDVNIELAVMLAMDRITHQDMIGFYKHTSYLFP